MSLARIRFVEPESAAQKMSDDSRDEMPGTSSGVPGALPEGRERGDEKEPGLVAALTRLLRSVVREELAALKPVAPSESEWLHRDGVAKLLGYSPNYIAELVRRWGLPSHGSARKRRFLKTEVLAWAEDHKRRTNGTS